MRIKRFEASDTYSAMAMVKEELGEDAVILSTRTLPGGRDRGKKCARIEVIAAKEYDASLSASPAKNTLKEETRPRQVFGYQANQISLKSDAPVPPVKETVTQDSFAKKLASNSDALAGRGLSPFSPQTATSFEASDLRLRFANFLKRQTQDEEVSESSYHKQAEGKGKPDPQQVAKWRAQIIDQLQINPLTIGGRKNAPTVMALIGPTGVGKTTTAAKIAAWYSIHEGLKVTLLSMDCYRIGATDQLRTYARIMRLPCEIALRKKDLSTALTRHNDKDLVIVDTAGKSPYDLGHVRELEDWFSVEQSIEPYLVLSATCKKEDLQQIVSSYGPLKLKGLLIAKLDETRAYASLCQMLAGTGLPVSALCTGQRVPEDFILASRDFLQILFSQGWKAAADELALRAQKSWTQ